MVNKKSKRKVKEIEGQGIDEYVEIKRKGRIVGFRWRGQIR